MKTRSTLSGGGAKGAYQIGALEVLDDHSYTYGTIAGVSIGSLQWTDGGGRKITAAG